MASINPPTGATTGMLRDWKFSIHFAHKNARAKLSYLPRWEALFIDSDELDGFVKLVQGDHMHKMKFAPLRKFLSFRDVSAAIRAGEHYQEIPKDVVFYYCLIPPGSQAKDFVKHCVKHVLQNQHCVDVDGDTNTKRLKMGKKMQCKHKLAGVAESTSFSFDYTLTYKTTLSNEHHKAFGGVVGETGYFITTMCSQKDELEAYFKDSIIPHLTDPEKFSLDIDVTYAEATHFGLQRQQELFGELRYMDTDAAIHFSLPMHPLVLKPDYSPIQSVGAGSVSAISIDLSVYQKLADELSEREVSGMPKYKANQVLLFIEVEDAARMGYGSTLSVEEYCLKKAKRVKEAFLDAREVGSHVTQNIGPRTGRSTTATFTYDVAGTKLSGSNVKAMLVSTLVGNNGVTALYFTKVGQGLFDAHLYLYQQLLRTVTFYHERQLTAKFSRHMSSTVIRLKDQDDLNKVYPKHQREMIELHAKSLHSASDGTVEGATLIQVGGDATPEVAAAASTNQRGSVSALLEKSGAGEAAGVEGGEENENETEEERAAREAEEASIISVTDIKHLSTVEAWELEEEARDGSQSGTGTVAAAAGSQKTDALSETDGGTSSPQQGGGGSNRETPHNEVAGDMGSKRSSVVGGGDSRPNSTHLERQSSQTSGSRPGTRNGRDSAFQLTVDSGEQQDGENGAARLSPNEQAETGDEEGGDEENKAGELTAEEIDALTKEVEDTTRGPNLHQCYLECCAQQQCRPNSYLLKKLPTHPRFVGSIEELDMASNYLGHSGFVAILHFLTYLKKVHTIHFNDMSLDNTDVDSLCTILAHNTTISTVHLKNNPKISLPSVRRFSQLIQQNRRIKTLSLSGAGLSEGLVGKLEAEAAKNEAISAELLAGQ